MVKSDIFWFKCVPADFLSDIDLQGMDAEQRGVAFWLWMNLYCNNGRLKYDLRKLSVICASNKETVKDIINEKFQLIDGFVAHKRVDVELNESQVRRNKAVKASKARWDKRDSAVDKDEDKQSISNAQASIEECEYSTVQYNTIQQTNNTHKQPQQYEIYSPQKKKFTEDECVSTGTLLGIPEEQCISFFSRYDSQGWIFGNGNPIVNLRSAMMYWKNNQHKFAPKGNTNGKPGEHKTWAQKDKEAREKNLKKAIEEANAMENQ